MKTPLPSPSKHSGFALTLALTLMSMILLLMLGLNTFIRVETINAQNSNARTQARQNAQLALQIAIGELQKHTGRDTKTTAEASILETTPSTTNIDGISEAHWVGVWDRTGTLETWLVSGNEGKTSSDSAFNNPQHSPSESINILDSGSIAVPKVQLVKNSEAYAYWISDEGIKAKINLSNNNSTLNISPLLAAQKIDISKMTDMQWISEIPDEELKRITSVSSLENLANNADNLSAIENHSFDLTAFSYNLLTNPKTGGLKKDLTLAFFDGSSPPTGQIFGPTSGAYSQSDPGGPMWSQLRNWATTSKNASGELVVQAQSDTTSGFYPIISQCQLHIIPRYGPAPDYNIYLNFIPAITLWNPYDTPLEATNYRVDIGRTFKSTISDDYVYEILLSNWKIKIEGGPAELILDSSNLPIPVVQAGISFQIPATRIEPGEAITFGAPSGNGLLNIFRKNKIPNTSQNLLTAGYSPINSYYIDTGFSLATRLGTATVDHPTFEFIGNVSMVKAFRLVDSISNTVLQEAFHLAGDSPAPAVATMQPHSGPILDLNGCIGIKTIRRFTQPDGDPSIKWLAHLNPRAAAQGPIPLSFHNKSNDELVAATNANPSYQPSMTTDDTDMQVGIPITGANAGVGYSVNPADIQTCILFESPPIRDHLQSIGQLMHASLYYPNLPNTDTRTDTLHRLSQGHFDNLNPAYAIGSSRADPYIQLNSTHVDWNDYPPTSSFGQAYADMQGRHYDHAYLLNDALWDNYFFSTLPSTDSRSPTNHRLVALSPNNTSPLNSTNSGGSFMIEGAFNVNSTSEEAWRSILAAFFGESLQSDQPEGAPFLRIHNSPGDAYTPESDNESSTPAYHGYRTLTNDQIINLAYQIVKEVKYRGPFTSLSEFVNRNPNKDAPTEIGQNAFRLKGALTSAIEAADNITTAEANNLSIDPTTSKINHSLKSNALGTTPRTESGFNLEAQQGWRSEAIPGWLTQADILARLGQVLTSRSDTFKIVVYGESVNPINGEVTIAKGEAIVQRIPEYINNIDNADTPYDSLTQYENSLFGRRYVLVNFKWLNNS